MSLPALAIGLIAFGQSAAADLAQDEKLRFNACLDGIETDAEAAYEDALAWLYEGSRPLARQCAALALIALGEVEEGALRLEALANAPDGGGIEDRTVYLAQAGNAWLSEGFGEQAEVALSNAVRLSPDDAEIRKDRAIAYLLLDRPFDALTDLDSAYELDQYDAEILMLRGKALFALDRLDDAQKAIEEARSLAPDNIDILVLRGEVREAIRVRGR